MDNLVLRNQVWSHLSMVWCHCYKKYFTIVTNMLNLQLFEVIHREGVDNFVIILWKSEIVKKGVWITRKLSTSYPQSYPQVEHLSNYWKWWIFKSYPHYPHPLLLLLYKIINIYILYIACARVRKNWFTFFEKRLFWKLSK